MISLLLSVAVVGLLCHAVYLSWRAYRTEKDVKRILQVLAAASPELGRRVVENGTRVKWLETWDDPDVFVSEDGG